MAQMSLKERFWNRFTGKDVDMTPAGSTTTYGVVGLMDKCGYSRPMADTDPVSMTELAIGLWPSIVIPCRSDLVTAQALCRASFFKLLQSAAAVPARATAGARGHTVLAEANRLKTSSGPIMARRDNVRQEAVFFVIHLVLFFLFQASSQP